MDFLVGLMKGGGSGAANSRKFHAREFPLKKLKSGIDSTGEKAYYDNKKWVFTVQCFHSSGLLVSFFIARMSYRYFLPFSAWLMSRRAWHLLKINVEIYGMQMV